MGRSRTRLLPAAAIDASRRRWHRITRPRRDVRARNVRGQRDAEDLVQTTFAQVLGRTRIIRDDNDGGYLLRALPNTYWSRYRALAPGPMIVPLLEDDALAAADPATRSRELVEAVASARPRYRDGVIAVDVLGLTYREAARSLYAREKTLVASRTPSGRALCVASASRAPGERQRKPAASRSVDVCPL